MLSLLRGFARSKVAMIIIGLLVVGLAAYALPNVFSGGQPRGMISAGDRFVVKGALDQRIDNYIQASFTQNQQRISRQDVAQSGVAEQIIQYVAGETAQLAYADEERIKATRFAVSNFVASAPRFRDPITGEFSAETYRSEVLRQSRSIEDFEKELRDSLTTDYVKGAVIAGADVPDALSKAWALGQSEERFISYVNVPNSVADEIEPPTEVELVSFYDERKQMFEKPQRRAVSILSISADDFVDDAKVSEEDIRAFYDFRIKDYSSPETRIVMQLSSTDRSVAQRAADEIGVGGDPKMVAAGIEGLSIRERTVQPDDIANQQYADVLFALPEGEVFGPMQVDDQWVTAKIVDITPGIPQPFESVSEEISQLLAQEAAQDIYEASLENFFDLIGGGFSLEEAGEQIGAPVMHFQPVDRTGRTAQGRQLGAFMARQGAMTIINNLAFEGETSDVLDDPADGGMMVYRLDYIEPANIPEFADIRDSVEAAYMVMKKNEAVETIAAAIIQSARESGDLDAAAAEQKLTVVDPGQALTRRQLPEGISRSVYMTTFNAAQDQFIEANEQDGSRTIVHVKKISTATPENLAIMAPAGKRVLQDPLFSDMENAFYGSVYEDIDLQFNSQQISEYLKAMAGVE
ncbi:MAG: hypothetical protein CME88_06505 [Hirschia sp.]|nr:hypothetical protein [Hirschia sp.]MBF18012.1 hypothetical protein [Hirschia sp.]|tara:strand:- start:6407 stop:8311 length:1905 start_codon:yes stop_codon:yes gene_type:complete